MPIVKDFDLNFNSRVIIWEITELETQLISMLKFSKKDKTLFNSIKLVSKRKEFIVIRLILNFLNIEINNLIYDPYGKPVLKLNKFISISHCFNVLVHALSKNEIGVDIEKERKKISIVKEKFLSRFENAYMEEINNSYIKINYDGQSAIINFKNEISEEEIHSTLVSMIKDIKK